MWIALPRLADGESGLAASLSVMSPRRKVSVSCNLAIATSNPPILPSACSGIATRFGDGERSALLGGNPRLRQTESLRLVGLLGLMDLPAVLQEASFKGLPGRPGDLALSSLKGLLNRTGDCAVRTGRADLPL